MIAVMMMNATIGQDLTWHNDQAMALPEKLTAGRDAEKDMK